MTPVSFNYRNSQRKRSATERRRAALIRTAGPHSQPTKKPAANSRLIRWGGTIAMSAAVVLVGLFMAPATARAGGLSVLTELLQAATTMATQAESLSASEASRATYSQTIVAPPAQLTATSAALNTLMRTYSTVMNIYNTISTHSATLPQTIALENSMFSTTAASIQPQYVNVYGSVPSTTNVPVTRASQIDMADSTANEALALANSSDQAESGFITTSQQELSNATTAAPGTSNMLVAQSAIMQLHSQSIEHHVLAALLRQQAIQAASRMSQVKQATTAQVSPTNTNISIP
jgi:hypothetical protein